MEYGYLLHGDGSTKLQGLFIKEFILPNVFAIMIYICMKKLNYKNDFVRHTYIETHILYDVYCSANRS